MTPIVNKRYDLYEQKKLAGAVTTSGDQQPMTFHLKSLKLVNKLVRLVINGNGKSGNVPKKSNLEFKQTKSSSPPPAVPMVKIPSPEAVTTKKSSSLTPAINIPKKSTSKNEKSTIASPKSPKNKSLSPSVSRPIPHLRRTLRDTATNRVYSYSVSIPNYVAEESEEELEEEKNSSSNYLKPYSYHHHHHQFISSSAPNCSFTSGTSFENHPVSKQAAPH